MTSTLSLFAFLAASLAALLPLAAAQFDTLCPGAAGGPYSAWNETRCPSATATCCASGFNPSGVGCCPFANAVCCPGSSFACCPSGTTCTLAEGSGYDARYNCTAASTGAVTVNKATCKGGPPLPMSTTLRNVLWIGDSLSLGMIPHVAANLSDIALVQHAPWGGDGGAEETTTGLRCLDYYLHSPSGMEIKPDVLLFNFGMHDGPMFNNTVPGQNANPANYSAELTAITASLVARAAGWGARLAFVETTEYMCSATSDGCVQNLNNQARAVMAAAGVPVIGLWGAMHGKCGDAPTTCGNAFNMTDGLFCPHANAIAYSYFGTTVVEPALRALLK